MSRNARLIAVDHVELQGPPRVEVDLRWFYGDLVGLRLISESHAPGPTAGNVIRFKSERVELRIALVDRPVIEAIACRASFEVPSLTEVTEMLDEKGYGYALCRGMRFTDRCLSLLDPAGNRVALRRHWPAMLF